MLEKKRTQQRQILVKVILCAVNLDWERLILHKFLDLITSNSSGRTVRLPPAGKIVLLSAPSHSMTFFIPFPFSGRCCHPLWQHLHALVEVSDTIWRTLLTRHTSAVPVFMVVSTSAHLPLEWDERCSCEEAAGGRRR